MKDSGRTFTVATDETLIELIEGARKRLAVIAPALTIAVAEAVTRRFKELGKLHINVTLDSDPEVYRLGFGDQAALAAIRTASEEHHFDLREQPGVRIGVVISDDITMIYAPVSRNIESGSTSPEKPNAVVMKAAATAEIAAAVGADTRADAPPPEVGTTALAPAKVLAMQADLKRNPPRPFDIARRLNVFSSKVQFVEFTAANCYLKSRNVRLPEEFVDVADEDLKQRIHARVNVPFESLGKLPILVDEGGRQSVVHVDGGFLQKDRKKIEDTYTYQINNYGRVILYDDRDAFSAAIERFKNIAMKYREALQEALVKRRSEFEQQIVGEFEERWKNNPPKYFERWRIEPTPQNIQAALRKLAGETFEGAIDFEPPQVRVLFKNVSAENVVESSFLDPLKSIMEKRRVPPEIIGSLFEFGRAAPQQGSFL